MQKENLRIAISQINTTVGDLEANCNKIAQYIQKAKAQGVDIITFPELALAGYPPEDLLLKPKFIADNLKKIKELAKVVDNILAIVGFVDKEGKDIYNAAAVIYNRKIQGVCHKIFLPNYGVFDEERYFSPGKECLLFKFGKFNFGVDICEDIWHFDGPTKALARSGARFILNINASPYYAGKIKDREEVVKKQAKANRIAIAYTNLVGGQDELVFDGQSMLVDAKGKLICRAKSFKEDLLIFDIEASSSGIRLKPQKTAGALSPDAEIYEALKLGLYDYCSKNGFKKVVIGLSGGIDSALVATVACDALGRENVTAVFMPSKYSSTESQEDAAGLAQNLKIKLLHIPIDEIYSTYLAALKEQFSGLTPNTAEENIQARIRGNILMALSNKFGWLVLTTGNKSEMSTGYATLYGDMAGGFALIKDCPKTLVYKLANYRNSLGQVIPERVLTKEPSAELKPNQKDSDTLPAYATLDPILKAYIEEDKDLSRIVSLGFDKNTVSRVLNMVDKSEYKRRQSPPGVKITPKAFGRDRRMPITNKYRG
ncbi:MAG: NAD+ synthase [Candidatus Omnitrophica bacterium]|nr:NAD+ synthase [Candidatus Omnitrophota bacterium]